jgi:hypothetical protein
MNPLVQAINGEFEERKAGFVEKTWGDRAIYHKGRAMTWGGGDGPGTSLQTYNYGPRYTENLIDDDQGTSADKGGMHDAGAGKVGSNARTEKTFGDTYGYQSGMAVSVHEGDVDHEHHGNVTELLEGDTEFKRTGKMKITQDGDVESEYMTNIQTSTHGDIKETTDGKVTSTILGKIKQKYNGGRETTELAKTTHTYKAALTVKQFSVEETTDNTKTENVKGAHMINYSSNVIEKGAKMKSQDAKMLMMKGSMAQMKINLIMIG